MKYILTFVGGAAAGALGVYLYFKKKMDSEINKQMTEFFERQNAMTAPDKIENVEVEVMEEQKSDIPDTTEKSSIVELTSNVRTPYHKRDNDGIEENKDKDEDYITDEEMAVLIETSQERMQHGPHVISEEERETCRGYDWKEFTWYPESDLLVEEEHDEQIKEPHLYFGDVEWRELLKDKQAITIRDNSMATDYTIYNNELNVEV